MGGRSVRPILTRRDSRSITWRNGAFPLDDRIKGNVVLPWFPYALGRYLYYLWPSMIEKQARKKYTLRRQRP